MSPNEPLDALHRDCLIARDAIRRRVRLLRFHASTWKPAPTPPRKEFP